MLRARQFLDAAVSGRTLLSEQFHSHWWIARGVTPVAAPARVLEPDTTAGRIAPRRADRRQQQQRGDGAHVST
ncbi:hypothetical protein JG688_00018295 [Phytophthora aleatoria]|uniref:Uncharacterized protein n=1 Tax=Phytophthora aleatoria TaxID=2496075 RepID=A0A8J5I3A7_9STRA|nr:hypothetical protein JG688_00018295 [Phytophthora aleatoria]